MPRTAKNPGANYDRRICRYTTDTWIVEDRLFVKVTALQWERATDDSFNLAARRKMRQVLEARGAPRALALGIGAVVEWDRSRNWADQLTDTITYQLAARLPQVETDATVQVA